jgi:nitrogen regulatory protein PII
VNKVEAFIRHEAFEPIRAELIDKGLPSLSVSEAKGSGRQKGVVERYRGSSLTINVRPKLKLEVVVEDKDKSTVVETILKHARTGEAGDGKIFRPASGGGDSHPHRRGRRGGSPGALRGGDARLGADAGGDE